MQQSISRKLHTSHTLEVCSPLVSLSCNFWMRLFSYTLLHQVKDSWPDVWKKPCWRYRGGNSSSLFRCVGVGMHPKVAGQFRLRAGVVDLLSSSCFEQMIQCEKEMEMKYCFPLVTFLEWEIQEWDWSKLETQHKKMHNAVLSRRYMICAFLVITCLLKNYIPSVELTAMAGGNKSRLLRSELRVGWSLCSREPPELILSWKDNTEKLNPRGRAACGGRCSFQTSFEG